MAQVLKSGKKLFDADLADSFFPKLLGIMFQNTPLRKKFTRPLLFVFDSESAFENSIHSMFCFVRFDAVYLDSNGIIIDSIPSIPPWELFITPSKPSKYLIELPSGHAKKYGLSRGTKISLRLD